MQDLITYKYNQQIMETRNEHINSLYNNDFLAGRIAEYISVFLSKNAKVKPIQETINASLSAMGFKDDDLVEIPDNKETLKGYVEKDDKVKFADVEGYNPETGEVEVTEEQRLANEEFLKKLFNK